MIQSQIPNNLEDLPLFIPIEMVGKILDIKRTSLYGLAKSLNFPSCKLGKKIVVRKEDFITWYSHIRPKYEIEECN